MTLELVYNGLEGLKILLSDPNPSRWDSGVTEPLKR
jgi:hypothetical protein